MITWPVIGTSVRQHFAENAILSSLNLLLMWEACTFQVTAFIHELPGQKLQSGQRFAENAVSCWFAWGVVEFTPPPSQSARTYHRALAPTTVRSHLPFDHSHLPFDHLHLVKSYGTAVPCRSKSTRHSQKLRYGCSMSL